VTVGAQPTNSSQTCVVAAGSGTATANVTNVSVTCTTTYPVSVAVDGLFGTGLVLENNGGDPLTVSANGAAAFSTNLASGAAYNVAVRTQPNATPVQTCAVSAGTGTVGNGPVTGVAVRCRAQAGRFLYVAAAAAAANGVAAFTIDASTGELTPIAGSPFPTTGRAPRVVFSGPAQKFLYVYGDDDITVPGGTTLTGFVVDQQTGALTAMPGLLVDLEAASPLIVFHPSGNFFYVPVTDSVLSATNNRLRSFAIHPTTGTLAEVLPTWGPFGPGEVLNSVAVSPNGASLYLASSIPPASPAPRTGTIRQLAVNGMTGELSGTPSLFTDAGNSFNQIFMHPAGTHVYTRNVGPGAQTSRFTLDVTTGAIGARSDIATAFGFGVAIAPGGRVYFPEFGGTFAVPGPGSVAGAVDGASGPVGLLPGSPYATGGTNSLAPVVDPTGRFLALTNLGSGNITVFRIDPAQGSLAHVPGSPYTPSVGATPGVVTFDPSARFAYLTDASTSSISSYVVDVDTGHPAFVSSRPTGGSPGGVVAIIGRQ
jgi:6-phosphogluconolactonase